VVGADREARRRDAVALHELLGEDLAAFEFGRGLRWADNRQATACKLIGHAGDQGRFRADDGQVGL
jgi:hypothetical protein